MVHVNNAIIQIFDLLMVFPHIRLPILLFQWFLPSLQYFQVLSHDKCLNPINNCLTYADDGSCLSCNFGNILSLKKAVCYETSLSKRQPYERKSKRNLKRTKNSNHIRNSKTAAQTKKLVTYFHN